MTHTYQNIDLRAMMHSKVLEIYQKIHAERTEPESEAGWSNPEPVSLV